MQNKEVIKHYEKEIDELTLELKNVTSCKETEQREIDKLNHLIEKNKEKLQKIKS